MTVPPATLDRTLVLYDGTCRFCQASVKLLHSLDWLGVLHSADAHDEALRSRHGITVPLERLLEEMHVVTRRGGVYHGFGAFRYLAWRLPALLLLAPLLYIPGVPQLGHAVYMWIARHRYQLVPCQHGECRLPPRPAK